MIFKGRVALLRLGRACAFTIAALLPVAPVSAAPAGSCDLASTASTRWTVAKDHGVAWLVTPCGERFLNIGADVVDAGQSGVKVEEPHYDWQRFAPSLPAWIDTNRKRLFDWGFNSAGAWSLLPQQLRLPTTINLELGRMAKFHWFDPFDPATTKRVFDEAKALTAPYRGTPYRIGYFSDNEVGWWDGALFVFFSEKPATNFTKQRLVAMLRRVYGNDWSRFIADFVPPPGVGSWPQLLAAESITHLRPGGNGIAAVRRWTEEVAEHYYAVTSAALKAADPDALFLGDRLPIYYDPVAVRAAARHVDVLSVNYNLDSPDGWVAPYFFDGLRSLSGGKPLLISEWFFAARENRSGNRNNGHLMTVDTQAERAVGAAAGVSNFARIPEILGIDWFQYYDYPTGGRADHEDYDFGLTDIHDQPYEPLVTAFGAANRKLPMLHEAARPMARQGLAHFRIPEARIDPAHHSLIDWPKPQSLLPALKTAPGNVAFGEAYLSWSDQGIALATVGQDYYDLDLLAYDGAFPLSEAYHLELDADLGTGPKRFTLYFIPPGQGAERQRPMAVRLCAGPAVPVGKNDCAEVPGAQALYFGADQPRVLAEILLPWSAFGLSAPPGDGRMKLEVSASAWYRARWMSLSGLPPARGSADPRRWATVTLQKPL